MDVSFVVVAPTYNNAGTVAAVLSRLCELGLRVIVVDDGSTDETPAILRSLLSVTVVTHLKNLGKAAALRSGFAAATELGFSHAVSIDTDGQLDPDDVAKLIAEAREHPNALVIGTR